MNLKKKSEFSSDWNGCWRTFLVIVNVIWLNFCGIVEEKVIVVEDATARVGVRFLLHHNLGKIRQIKLPMMSIILFMYSLVNFGMHHIFFSMVSNRVFPRECESVLLKFHRQSLV